MVLERCCIGARALLHHLGRSVPQTTIRPRITFVVWAGYDDNRPAGLYGGRVHGPIFRRFLSEKHVQAALRALLQEKP